MHSFPVSDVMEEENPYQPVLDRSQRAGVDMRSFRFGSKKVFILVVESSIWSGVSTFFVDPKFGESPKKRGPCKLEFGNEERHQVEIRIDSLGRLDLVLNDCVIESDLFADKRKRILRWVGVLTILLFCMMLGLFFFGFFGFERQFSL
ncbi:MAG: hypothetical protein AAF483_21255 [Planctomycetota bacterium]